MDKGGVRITKLTTLLFTFLILILISGTGGAAEIFVQPSGSIQAAVNSASSGDIISVKPGTYTENIVVTKSDITIRSESGNPDDTIIKYKSAYSNVFLLQGSNIKIIGFKISGSNRSPYAGVNLSSCSNCVVENNKLLNNARGIYLLKSSGITVSKNNAANSAEYGIALQSANGNILSGNTASGNQRGVYFGTSDDNTLSSNTVESNSVYGFFICGLSDRNRVYNNYFNNVNMTIRNGIGNSYSTAKTAGTNIVGGPYIGGNFWGNPSGTGFSQTSTDANGDGISDLPYKNITGSVYSDNLPLVTSSNPQPTSPVAGFSSNVTSGNLPLAVTFTDTSTGTPTSWNWNFGDGTVNSTTQNPVHVYSKEGNYTVTLTASSSAGSSTATKPSYITVSTGTVPPNPLVVDFTSNATSGNLPLTVAFTDTSTGSSTAWNWNFGDGTANSTAKNPVHTYSTAGTYTVTLTATNSGGSNTVAKSGYITVTANTTAKLPVVSFWASRTSGTVPITIGFTDASTNTPTAWNWDFGDGTYSTVQNPRHTYTSAGTYSITLTASNAAGSATKTRYNYITLTGTTTQKPVASFNSNTVSGTVPFTVAFTDTSTGSPTAWNWNFGDGTVNSTSQNPSHTYSTAGTYTVTLTASNSAGSNTITKSNYITVTSSVTPQTPPVASFSSNSTSGTVPLTVAFTDTSTGSPTAWNWNFGDGTANSTVQKPTHTYSTAGNYTVTLTASNSAGSNTKQVSSYIKATAGTTTIKPPVVSFWASRTTGTTSTVIGFTDASTNTPTTWKWNFGDGTYSTLKSPRHTYKKAGTYSITLTASNAGGSGTKTRSNYIKIT